MVFDGGEEVLYRQRERAAQEAWTWSQGLLDVTSHAMHLLMNNLAKIYVHLTFNWACPKLFMGQGHIEPPPQCSIDNTCGLEPPTSRK